MRTSPARHRISVRPSMSGKESMRVSVRQWTGFIWRSLWKRAERIRQSATDRFPRKRSAAVPERKQERKKTMSKLIYLDNAATTKTAPEVVEAMLPFFTEYYGNPSSVYSFASKSKEAVTRQREIIAGALAPKRTRSILLQAARRVITGQSRRQRKPMSPKENTLSHPKLSIMRFCILASTWSTVDLR